MKRVHRLISNNETIKLWPLPNRMGDKWPENLGPLEKDSQLSQSGTMLEKGVLRRREKPSAGISLNGSEIEWWKQVADASGGRIKHNENRKWSLVVWGASHWPLFIYVLAEGIDQHMMPMTHYSNRGYALNYKTGSMWRLQIHLPSLRGQAQHNKLNKALKAIQLWNDSSINAWFFSNHP